MELAEIKQRNNYYESIMHVMKKRDCKNDFDIEKLLIRASSLGGIMQSDKPTKLFTDTQIDKMVEIYNSFFFNRYEEIDSKYLTKGNDREQDSITLLSIVKNKMYVKNTVRKSNAYTTGEWDLHVLENGEIAETIDIKTSWSKNTFDKARVKKTNTDYFWQGKDYMWLTGAKKHTVAYCLVNGTFDAIQQEKNRVLFKKGMSDISGNPTPQAIAKLKQIEINRIFDIEAFKKECPGYEFDNDLNEWTYDIPKEKRVHTISFDRDENAILAIQKRVIEVRNWINENLNK